LSYSKKRIHKLKKKKILKGEKKRPKKGHPILCRPADVESKKNIVDRRRFLIASLCTRVDTFNEKKHAISTVPISTQMMSLNLKAAKVITLGMRKR
jgi:hypothetical protein